MSEVTQTAAQDTPTAAPGASTPTQGPALTAKAPEAAKAPAPAQDAGTKAAAPEAPKTEPGKEKAVEAKAESQTETKPASEEKPVVPEKYDLKLPKDSALSDAHIEKLSSYAKDKGYSNEQAQALLERESQAVSDYTSSLKEKQSQLQTSWVEQANSDKEIGGEAFKQNAELAKRVVTRFGTEEFKKELNKTGLGNHPELLRIFTRIGKAMGEDTLILPGQGPSDKNQKKSTADLLYGDSTKEN